MTGIAFPHLRQSLQYSTVCDSLEREGYIDTFSDSHVLLNGTAFYRPIAVPSTESLTSDPAASPLSPDRPHQHLSNPSTSSLYGAQELGGIQIQGAVFLGPRLEHLILEKLLDQKSPQTIRRAAQQLVVLDWGLSDYNNF